MRSALLAGRTLMIVMKFGGTSVADAARIREMAEIVAARVDETPLVVVSALGGATDRLLECAGLAAAGDGPAALRGLNDLAERHRDTVRALELPASENEALA